MRLIISAGKIACLIFLFYSAISCNLEKRVNESPKDDSGLIGISGMDKVNDSTYLAVYDLKSFEEGPRIGVVVISEDVGLQTHPVTVSNWQHEDGAGSDLESVCSLPERENEFLIAESGKWEGNYGRIFHIRLNDGSGNYKAEVLGVFDMPEFDAKGPEDNAGDEIEGIACITTGTNRIMVLLGERGGSRAYQHGLIRWAEADLGKHELKWTQNGETGVTINAPGHWTNDSLNRDISGLYIDEVNGLWAVASEELGENGPFNSIIFRIGRVQGNSDNPIDPSDPMVVYKRVDGYKVEGISAGTGLIPGSVFTIGTEDEQLGGSWRVLN